MTVIEMKNEMMTIKDFEERAMAYGADLDVWPEEDRAPARSLLAGSTVARAALDDARALDATLALWNDAVAPSQALLSRVLTDAVTVSEEEGTATPAPAAPVAAPARGGWLAALFGDRPLLRPGLALAACLALGFVMGTALDEQVMAPEGTEIVDEVGLIDFAFAMEDDADLLLGPGALL